MSSLDCLKSMTASFSWILRVEFTAVLAGAVDIFWVVEEGLG